MKWSTRHNKSGTGRVSPGPGRKPGGDHGFTLIELLVVVAIISILAAMLLPALSRARDQAIRIDCLSRKKQLGVAVALFADDHDGLVPHPISKWRTTSNREMDKQVKWARGYCYKLWEDNDTCSSLGTLTAFGYVGDPRMLFCEGFKRSSINAQTAYDLPKYAHVWEGILAQGDNYAGTSQYRMMAGVATHWMVRGPWINTEIWTKGYTRYNVRLSYIGELWKRHNQISPILISCANYAQWGTTWKPETDAAGVTYAASLFGPPQSNGAALNVSHNLQGVNASFVDGSGRWISRNEVYWTGYNPTSGERDHLMATHYPFNGNFHKFAQRRLTPGK